METTFDIAGNMISTPIKSMGVLLSSFTHRHPGSNRSLRMFGIPLPGLAAHMRSKSTTDIPLDIAATTVNKKDEPAVSRVISPDLLNRMLASPSTVSAGLGNVSMSTINRIGTEKSMCTADTLPALAEVREEGL
uniref:Uncharacterized protein n=1 Tax=Elaeophora elaphi TaxID=1147741 RepID=A0A0R3RXL4_9BILA